MSRITLRQKPLSNKRQRLFLDYYPPIPNPDNGKPIRKEYLKLFVYDKPKDELSKKHNKETLLLAENIKAQRQLDIQQQDYGFISDNQRGANFVDYFKAIANKRHGSNSGNWASALYYLEGFTGGTLPFKDINPRICNQFKEYLATTPSNKSKVASLSRNSCVSYFGKFKHCLKQAYKDGFLREDINSKVEPIKTSETRREYLSLEELQRLVDTDCPLPVLKRAALFSALTGMRFIDIKNLKWSAVQYNKQQGGYLLKYKQQKTQGIEELPIADDAYNLLLDSGEPDDHLFPGLNYSKHVDRYFKPWVEAAGIIRNITFHSLRHTYATLQLSFGTDLYTVSKMLGHREIKTTQIYAKVIDKTKREAAGRIQLDFTKTACATELL